MEVDEAQKISKISTVTMTHSDDIWSSLLKETSETNLQQSIRINERQHLRVRTEPQTNFSEDGHVAFSFYRKFLA